MSGQWEYCERTVSELWADRQRTDSGMWAYRDRKSKRTESGLWAYRERTVSGQSAYRERNVSVPWSEKWAYRELTANVLWADSERTVGERSAYRERNVSVPWAYCERTVSVLTAECERTVIGKVSVPRTDCESTMRGQWENCGRTVRFIRCTVFIRTSVRFSMIQWHLVTNNGTIKPPVPPSPHHLSCAICANSSQLRPSAFTNELRQLGNIISCITVSVSTSVCFPAWLLHRLFHKRKQHTKTNCPWIQHFLKSD